MSAKLLRPSNDHDISWSEIGPRDHRRAYFNHIDLVGYAAINSAPYEVVIKTRRDGAPYRIYAASEWRGEKPSRDKHYATEAAAKRAGRAWIVNWLKAAEPVQLIWETFETGVHFTAHVPSGPKIGSYYFCPEPRGHWHAGFQVYFGGTFYTTKFADPDEARAAMQVTWEQWLEAAKQHLLK